MCVCLSVRLWICPIAFVWIWRNSPTFQVANELGWEDDDDQVQLRKQSFSRHFDSLPNDFEHFDFAESEQRINDIAHASDEWAYHVHCDGVPVESGSLSLRQQQIDSIWSTFPPTIEIDVHPYVVNWLSLYRPEQETLHNADSIRRALLYLQEHGFERDKGLATTSLQNLDKMPSAVGKCETKTEIAWGEKLKLIDCESGELTFGVVRFHGIDFGDMLDLNTGLQQELSRGDAVEKNQCALLAMAAGAEWSLQKRPRRAPSRSRVQFSAKEMLGAEMAMVRLFSEPMPRVLQSATRDVVSIGGMARRTMFQLVSHPRGSEIRAM